MNPMKASIAYNVFLITSLDLEARGSLTTLIEMTIFVLGCNGTGRTR